MPYASNKQAAFMHIHHPDIAADWHEKGHGYVKGGKNDPGRKKKGRITKSKKDWGIGLSTAAVGGALANQVPPIRVNRKKKAKVEKLLVPAHDDPFFNQAAAQKTFDLVMKMDDDTAEMFCHIVASDLLEQEIEKNLGTLQRHLNQVVSKQLHDAKRAMARRISKGGDEDPEPYARALVLIEEEIKKVDEIPNWEFERKIVRDPSSGRFRTKITPTKSKDPIKDKTAAALGIKGTDRDEYKKLNDKEKAKYQNEYQQVARFLDAVNASTNGVGNATILMHYKDDKTGDTWVEEHNSEKPPHKTMLETNTTVTGVEAKPKQLTVGGAAFSLSGAMGGNQISPDRVKAINAAHQAYGTGENNFANQWTKAGAGEAENANARLYGRTKLLGEVAGTVGPEGGKVQLAGQLAEVVGQYGPQAEQVLGPSARKSAYRYRGTERSPDKRLVNMYAEGIKQNKKVGPLDPWTEREEMRIRRARGVKQPFGSETGVRPKGSQIQRGAGPAPAKGLRQEAMEAQERAERAPEWQEREYGRRAVEQYLKDRLPSKSYYKLHLEAGNTPPSEGVIINSDGQIVTQASGYGDDHYLPFNLKNLKGLKGGEYVRSRSVGGLTSEDIYTGLISGARRVTVVSRSGTFTMEFQPDFRGGRRHNDKARRMTRRYEQILDAVQAGQVERKDVPPVWKDVIAQEVKDEYGPSASKAMLRTEIDARITEFKENPKIDGRDLDRAEAAISNFEAQQQMGLVGSEDVAAYREEVMNELRDMKEVRFRLNGEGYKAALDSLEEQFPYYIHAMSIPKKEHLVELEQDRGYVEPGRNRPTAAKAGWHGTAGKEHSGKFSAAHANYQRGKAGAPEPGNTPAKARERIGFTGGTAAAEKEKLPEPAKREAGETRSDRELAEDKVKEDAAKQQGKIKLKNAAVDLHMAIKDHALTDAQGNPAPAPEWWKLGRDDFRTYVSTPDNLTKFHKWATDNAASMAGASGSSWVAYQNAAGAVDSKPYSKETGRIWPTQPYSFKGKGEAFRPNPDPGVVRATLNQIDGKARGLVHDKPLSELTEQQLQDEVEQAAIVMATMDGPDAKKMSPEDLQRVLAPGYFANPGSGFVSRFFKGGADAHLEAVHQVRALKKSVGSSLPAASSPPSAPPAATPPASTPPAQSPPQRTGGGGKATVTPGQKATALPSPAHPGMEVVLPEDAEKEKVARLKHVAELRRKYVQTAVRKAKEAEASGDQDRVNALSDFAEKAKHISASDPQALMDFLKKYENDEPELFRELVQKRRPGGRLQPL